MLHRPLYRFLGAFLKRFDRRKIATKKLMGADFNYGIQNARLINSRTIIFSCDIYPDNPHSSIANIPYLDTILSRLTVYIDAHPNSIPSIYVPSDGLVYFAENVLPQIQSKFILVSGDSDLPINKISLGLSLDILLNSKYIIAWHAQNRDFDHEKLHSLPIGINLHNLWANPLQWGGGFILPTLQELELQTIADSAPDFPDRQPKIFCNWHFSIDRADRRECYEHVDHSVCYFQPKPAPMADTWAMQSQYQFVLSPHGAGLDCHRTWEALLLGCIPIIKAARINDLFSDLPVVVVNDWKEVNAALLAKASLDLGQKSWCKDKLFMSYWKAKITKPKTLLQSEIN